MEKELQIPTEDGHVIYGTLNSSDTKSDKLIVFVHGFTGHSNEHFFYNAARFFPSNGFYTFRFNLYRPEKDARKLTETSVSEHVLDFQTVLAHFKDQYEHIYAVGHSLGAHAVVRSKSSLDAVVLWEPAVEVSELCASLDFDKKSDCYIEHSNVDILVGKNFVEDAQGLPPIASVMASFDRPVKIIGGEVGGTEIAEKTYFAHARDPKDIYIIKGSGHTFDEGDAERELFKETLEWFEKF